MSSTWTPSPRSESDHTEEDHDDYNHESDDENDSQLLLNSEKVNQRKLKKSKKPKKNQRKLEKKKKEEEKEEREEREEEEEVEEEVEEVQKEAQSEENGRGRRKEKEKETGEAAEEKEEEEEEKEQEEEEEEEEKEKEEKEEEEEEEIAPLAPSTSTSTPASSRNSRPRGPRGQGSDLQRAQRQRAFARIMTSLSLTIRTILICELVVVLILSASETCASPLRLLLIGFLVRVAVSIPLVIAHRMFETGSRASKHVKRLQGMVDFLGAIWFIFGNWWLFSAVECKETAPLLFYNSFVFICFGYLMVVLPLLFCLSLICCLPCILVYSRRFKDPRKNGTSDAIIQALTVKPYTEDLMQKEDAVCVVCLSEYEAGDNLKYLPCNHHFHPQCIDEWLKINKHCPLCMQNVDPNDVVDDPKASEEPENNV